MISERENQMAIAYAQAIVASTSEDKEPFKLEIFEDAYNHALDDFKGKYPDLN